MGMRGASMSTALGYGDSIVPRNRRTWWSSVWFPAITGKPFPRQVSHTNGKEPAPIHSLVAAGIVG
jgi:hypothetical protein